MKALTDQMANLVAARPHTNASQPMIKLPVFNIDKDKEGFQMWKGRWDNHIKAHRIHTIVDEEERKECMHVKLTAALSNKMLKWITY